MKKIVIWGYKLGIAEIFLLFIYIIVINNFLRTPDQRIVADGAGYYDYLLSTLIYDDYNRNDITSEDPIYNRILQHGFYVEFEENKRVNKYTCGTAILQLPFFLVARSTIGEEEPTGMEKPFHTWAFHGALFYLFFGLILFRFLAKEFQIDGLSIFICQGAIVFATCITHELNFSPFGSHIYSFFVIAGFLYFTRRYFKEGLRWLFYIACVFLGFILILRQINVLVLLFLPFVAGDWQTFKSGMLQLFKPVYTFLIGFGIVFAIGLIQVFFWYYQTGNLIVYSYGEERFFLWDSHILDVLFSYRRSLFVYAPITIISFLGLVVLLLKRKFYLILTWFLPFYLIVYIFSCWWDWTYGASYGQRVFVDYYPLIFIMIGIFLKELRWYGQLVILFLTIAASYVNVIQVYQFKHYILDWHSLTEMEYKQIFLKTDRKFEGVHMQLPDKPKDLYLINSFDIPEVPMVNGVDVLLGEFVDSVSTDRIQFVQLELSSDFNEKSDAEFIVIIDDLGENKNVFWTKRYLVHFAKWEFNTYHQGYFLIGLDLPETNSPRSFKVIVKSDQYFDSYENMKLNIFRKY